MRIHNIFKFLLKTLLLSVLFFVFLGASLWLTISFSVKKDIVKTPDLKGMNVSDASEMLASMELKLFEKERIFDESTDRDIILFQYTSPGLKIKKGHTIEVTVSSGMEQLIVPNLVGHSGKKAQIMLEQAKLSLGTTYMVYKNGFEENTVIAQEPPAMSKRSPGTNISVVISKGSPAKFYVMPDIVGLPSGAAQDALSEIGLRNLNVIYNDTEAAGGAVISQSPAAGRKVKNSDIVTITLARK